MRPSLLVVLFAALALPAWGEDVDPDRAALVEAAKSARMSITDALSIAYNLRRRPLQAELRLDQHGRLVLRATIREADEKNERFEDWTGPVGAAGWAPVRRPLTAGNDLQLAKQAAALVANKQLLRQAILAAERTDERAGPGDRVLGVRPIALGRRTHLRVTLLDGDRIEQRTFDPKESTFSAATVSPTPKRLELPALVAPPLPTKDVTWFNVEKDSPVLGKGRPTLVVITNPG